MEKHLFALFSTMQEKFHAPKYYRFFERLHITDFA